MAVVGLMLIRMALVNVLVEESAGPTTLSYPDIEFDDPHDRASCW